MKWRELCVFRCEFDKHVEMLRREADEKTLVCALRAGVYNLTMNNINIEELPVGRKLLLVTIEENFSLDGYFFKEERYTLENSEEGLSIYRHGITRRPMQWRKCQIPNNVIEMRRQFEFTADDPTHRD